MTTEKTRLGILTGGGPAPGINGAISACVIEAVHSGLEVIGITDGFARLAAGDTSTALPLGIPDVAHIHSRGGSILRTSRANPTRSPEILERSVAALRTLGIRHLVTIGGDDTAFSAYELACAAEGAFRVAHIPKTIDNDLPLPGDIPTFGYETARHVGTKLVLNLIEDARTTDRWYLVVAMGRAAGHLALGIGKAAGATITIIPEEFTQETIRLDDVCGVLEGAILKQRVLGRRDGLAVIAEGIAVRMEPDELAGLPGVEISHDPYGHVQLAEVPLAAILSRQLRKRFASRGERISLVDSTIGYELRSASPVPFDIEYTRTLGHGAVQLLLEDCPDERLRFGGFVCLIDGELRSIPFEDLRDPATGRTRVRRVDTNSAHYQVARSYMTRLTRADLDDAEMVRKLADAAGIAPDELVERFGPSIRATEPDRSERVQS